MPQVVMRVQKTELVSPIQGQITATCVNGAIQGTLTLTAGKQIVKAVDPGEDILVVFNKV